MLRLVWMNLSCEESRSIGYIACKSPGKSLMSTDKDHHSAAKCTEKRLRIPLKRPEQVTKVMARMIREAVRNRGKGGVDVANEQYKVVMMCSMLLKGLESTQIEKRLQEIEERLGLRRKP
jgi:hypothetical protein